MESVKRNDQSNILSKLIASAVIFLCFGPKVNSQDKVPSNVFYVSIINYKYFVFFSFGRNVTGKVPFQQVSDYYVDDFEAAFPMGKVVTAKVLR